MVAETVLYHSGIDGVALHEEVQLCWRYVVARPERLQHVWNRDLCRLDIERHVRHQKPFTLARSQERSFQNLLCDRLLVRRWLPKRGCDVYPSEQEGERVHDAPPKLVVRCPPLTPVVAHLAEYLRSLRRVQMFEQDGEVQNGVVNPFADVVSALIPLLFRVFPPYVFSPVNHRRSSVVNIAFFRLMYLR